MASLHAGYSSSFPKKRRRCDDEWFTSSSVATRTGAATAHQDLHHHAPSLLTIEPCSIKQIEDHVSLLQSEIEEYADLITMKTAEISHAELRIEYLKSMPVPNCHSHTHNGNRNNLITVSKEHLVKTITDAIVSKFGSQGLIGRSSIQQSTLEEINDDIVGRIETSNGNLDDVNGENQHKDDEDDSDNSIDDKSDSNDDYDEEEGNGSRENADISAAAKVVVHGVPAERQKDNINSLPPNWHQIQSQLPPNWHLVQSLPYNSGSFTNTSDVVLNEMPVFVKGRHGKVGGIKVVDALESLWSSNAFKKMKDKSTDSRISKRSLFDRKHALFLGVHPEFRKVSEDSRYSNGMTLVAMSINDAEWNTLLEGDVQNVEGFEIRRMFAEIQERTMDTALQLEVETNIRRVGNVCRKKESIHSLGIRYHQIRKAWKDTLKKPEQDFDSMISKKIGDN